MKKIILILLVLIYGCERKDGGIEIIPDYDAIYLPASEVDVPTEILGDEDKHLEEIEKIIGNHFTPQNQAFYFFRAKMYVNENGELDKIQYSKEEPYKEFKDADINPEIEDLFPKLTKYLRDMKFTSAQLNNKKVKSQFMWEASFSADKDGEAEFYLGSLELKGLSALTNFNSDEYMEKVDEMPFPVGGMAALAKNVVYPKKAKEEGIQGRVFVKAFIDEEGDVIWTEMVKGIGGGCELAAINAVEATKFTPGKQNGKPVKTQIMIPILFKLQ
ncbi:MAG: energy transducer TonB [Melioribacteraceae bacterium]|nr:energy transducer TonB [Melioribacteraceae bacterium]